MNAEARTTASTVELQGRFNRARTPKGARAALLAHLESVAAIYRYERPAIYTDVTIEDGVELPVEILTWDGPWWWALCLVKFGAVFGEFINAPRTASSFSVLSNPTISVKCCDDSTIKFEKRKGE